MVTGDDTPAGGGNSGGFSPFNDQLTNESQTVAVSGATGGTFTLTFDGQTTAPIAVHRSTTPAIESALEALSNLDDVAVHRHAGTPERSTSAATRPRAERPAHDRRRLRPHRHDADASRSATINNGQGINIPAEAGLFNAPHVDARRSALNTNDLRGKILRITVKDGDITPAEENRSAARTRSRRATCSRPGRPGPRPEIYAMGFRNPFRITLDKDDVAYVTDYSPDSQRRSSSAARPAPAGSRSSASRRTTAGRCATRPTCRTTGGTSTRRRRSRRRRPETHECDNPARGPGNTSRWVANGGPAVDPGLAYAPPITNPEIWYSYQDNKRHRTPQGTPCFAATGRRSGHPVRRPCPQLFPELFTGRRRAARRRAVRLRPAQPEPDEVPALLRRGLLLRRVHAGHAARDPAGLARTTSSRSTTRCPAARRRQRRPGRGCATTRWTWCSAPTARSTCSRTATASSPSTRTPG